MRTALLSAVVLVGLVAAVVGILVSSLGPPEGPAPGTRSQGEPAGATAGSSTPATGGPAIVGTVTVASELRGRLGEGDTLFIIARQGPGPPFAVQRIPNPRFPLPYRLGPEDIMVAGTPFQGEVSVSARVSKGGSAGPAQPGDLEGEYPGRVTVGGHDVNIVISRLR